MSDSPIQPLARPEIRLTTMAHGGGCASKIPPGELEEVVAGLHGATAGRTPSAEVLVGLDDSVPVLVVSCACRTVW